MTPRSHRIMALLVTVVLTVSAGCGSEGSSTDGGADQPESAETWSTGSYEGGLTETTEPPELTASEQALADQYAEGLDTWLTTEDASCMAGPLVKFIGTDTTDAALIFDKINGSEPFLKTIVGCDIPYEDLKTWGYRPPDAVVNARIRELVTATVADLDLTNEQLACLIDKAITGWPGDLSFAGSRTNVSTQFEVCGIKDA